MINNVFFLFRYIVFLAFFLIFSSSALSADVSIIRKQSNESQGQGAAFYSITVEGVKRPAQLFWNGEKALLESPGNNAIDTYYINAGQVLYVRRGMSEDADALATELTPQSITSALGPRIRNLDQAQLLRKQFIADIECSVFSGEGVKGDVVEMCFSAAGLLLSAKDTSGNSFVLESLHADMPVFVEQVTLPEEVKVEYLSSKPTAIGSSLASREESSDTALSTVNEPVPASSQGAYCPELSLEKPQATGMAAISVQGLPEHWEMPSGAVVEYNDELFTFAFVARDDKGTYLVAPLPLTQPWQGETVRLHFTNWQESCQPVELDIAPLQPAPEAIDRYLAASQKSLQHIATQLGVDYSAMTGEGAVAVKSVNPLAAWLSLSAQALEGQGMQGGLIQRIDRLKRSDSSEDQESLKVLNAILAVTGSVETRERQAEQFSRLQFPLAVRPLNGEPSTITGWLAKLLPTAHANEAVVTLSPDVWREELQPQSAAELSLMMNKQFKADIGLQPDVQIYRDLLGTELEIGGEVAQIYLGGPKSPVGKGFKVATDIASDAVFAWVILDKLKQGLFPSTLHTPRVHLDNPRLFLDKLPKSGHVNAFTVIPRSQGLELSKLLLDAILKKLTLTRQGLGKVNTGGKRAWNWLNNYRKFTQKKTQHISEFDPKFLERLLKKQRALAAGESSVGAFADNLLKWMASNYGVANFPDAIRIEAFDYKPVNLLEAGYYQASTLPQSVIELGFLSGERLPYRALNEGSTFLRLMSMPGKFALHDTVTTNTSVTVGQEVNLTIHPSWQTVLPGEEVSFDVLLHGTEGAQVMGLKHPPEVKPDSFSVAAVEGVNAGSDGWPYAGLGWQVKVKASSELAEAAGELTVRSRQHPRYSASAQLFLPTIMPNFACMSLNEQRQFYLADHLTAPIKRGDLEWVVERGSGVISADGIYTAPSTSKKNERVVVTVSTEHGIAARHEFSLQCGCYFDMQVQGKQVRGNKVTLSKLAGGLYGITGRVPDSSEQFNFTFKAKSPFGGKRWKRECDEKPPHATKTISGGGTVFMPGVGATVFGVYADVPIRSGVDGHCPGDKMNAPKAPHAPFVSIIDQGDGYAKGTLSGVFYIQPSRKEQPLLFPVHIDFRAATDLSSSDEVRDWASNPQNFEEFHDESRSQAERAAGLLPEVAAMLGEGMLEADTLDPEVLNRWGRIMGGGASIPINTPEHVLECQ